MKDAKGHGSERRGFTVGFTPAEHARIYARSMARQSGKHQSASVQRSNNAVKAWYAKAATGKDFQHAASAYGNAMDTFPAGEHHPDFWGVVKASARDLVDMSPQFQNVKLPKGW